MSSNISNTQTCCDLCGGELSKPIDIREVSGKSSRVRKCLECGSIYSVNPEKGEVFVNRPNWGEITINLDCLSSDNRDSLFDLLRKKWSDLENGITQQSLLSGQIFELNNRYQVKLIGPIGSYYEIKNEVFEQLRVSNINELVQYSAMPHNEIEEILKKAAKN